MKKIKRLLKSLLPPVILDAYRLIRPIQEEVPEQPRYYGLFNLDEKLEKFLDKDDGFFVELGANDGISQSNTLYFEKFRNWRGVLVEPSPNKFLECIKNRAPRTRVFCNACVSFDYGDKYVDMHYSNLMTVSIVPHSDLKDPLSHLKEGERHMNRDEVSFSYGTLAKTLNELLLDADAPEVIDLLSLDVEGAELEVLLGVDHARFRFKYICIETRSFEKMRAFLEGHDYLMVEQMSYHDYLFKHKAL